MLPVKRSINLIFCTALLISALSIQAVSNQPLTKIKKYVENGTVMLNDETGKNLIAINPDKLYIPASIIKVLTAAITLDLLGGDFRFKTECSIDSVSDLIIKGYGDPFLVSDEIRILAQNLKKTGVTSINKLLFDHSFFAEDLSIPGISTTNNPYDALNGALVVNFNTINVGKNASGEIYSAEEETPLTPLAKAKAVSFPLGTKERINLSAEKSACNRYVAELFAAILREQGITIADSSFGTATLSDSEPAYTHYNSRTLTEVLKGLLKYSNNFIANQIFLYIGADKKNPPATMQKGRSIFEDYIRNTLKIPEEELVMVEGSGISRGNQVSGNVMLSIMERFKPHADLLTPKKGHPVKSGTLLHISNYVGYIKTDRGLRSFVIILNQKKNYRDTLLKLLADYP